MPLYATQKSFMRSVTPTTTTMSDSDELMSDFLFRRRRPSAPVPPPVQVQPIIIKTNTFSVNFYAKGVRGIFVQPGEWLNSGLLEQYKAQLGYVFGPNGNMGLLPEVIYGL